MNTQVAKPKKSHVIFIDILRAIAIFGVVSIHGLDQILRFNSDLTSPVWWYANIANSSVRWVLPAFFMISGMLLLAKDENTLFFLKKRLNKILLPTIIWSGIYGVWIWSQYNRSLSISEHTAQTVVFGTPYYHLYFLFAILGFYLLNPILSIFTRFASQKRMLYAIGLTFFAACIGNIFMGWQLQVYPNTRLLSLFQWLPFTGYYLAGYYLSAYPLSISNKKSLGLVSFAIFVAAIGTYVLTTAFGHGPRGVLFQDYLSPGVIITSLLVFNLFIKLAVQKIPGWIMRSIQEISRASFGIYLIHVIVMETLARLIFPLLGDFQILSNIVLILSTLFVSFIFVKLLSYIPGLKKTIGY